MIPWLYDWNDPDDPLFSADKADHALGGAFAGALCHARAMPLLVALGVVLVLAVTVECVEVARYEAWQARGAPQPWPGYTDKASGKDVAWGILGGLCGWWLSSVLWVWR